MLISELPRRVKAKAIRNKDHNTFPHYDKKSDEIFRSFSPLHTEEGYNYWAYWAERNPSIIRLNIKSFISKLKSKIMRVIIPFLIILGFASCATTREPYFIVVGRVEHSKHRTFVYPRNLMTEKTTKHAYVYPFADVRVNDTVLIHRSWIAAPTFY